jgi:hypothetical protein
VAASMPAWGMRIAKIERKGNNNPPVMHCVGGNGSDTR